MNLNIPPNKMKINSLIAGICLFFSSLFSCQQKGDFKSVSVEDFSTLIANPEIQRLDVRTVAEYSESPLYRKINPLLCIAVVVNAVKRLPLYSAKRDTWFTTSTKVSKNGKKPERK